MNPFRGRPSVAVLRNQSSHVTASNAHSKRRLCNFVSNLWRCVFQLQSIRGFVYYILWYYDCHSRCLCLSANYTFFIAVHWLISALLYSRRSRAFMSHRPGLSFPRATINYAQPRSETDFHFVSVHRSREWDMAHTLASLAFRRAINLYLFYKSGHHFMCHSSHQPTNQLTLLDCCRQNGFVVHALRTLIETARMSAHHIQPNARTRLLNRLLKIESEFVIRFGLQYKLMPYCGPQERILLLGLPPSLSSATSSVTCSLQRSISWWIPFQISQKKEYVSAYVEMDSTRNCEGL